MGVIDKDSEVYQEICKAIKEQGIIESFNSDSANTDKEIYVGLIEPTEDNPGGEFKSLGILKGVDWDIDKKR